MNKREAYIISDDLVRILVAERNRKNIKYSRMAIELGMSKSSVSNIEKLTQKPTLPTYLMIANYLGLSLEEIVKRLNKK